VDLVLEGGNAYKIQLVGKKYAPSARIKFVLTGRCHQSGLSLGKLYWYDFVLAHNISNFDFG
jgi:hypothetical protein